MLGDLSNFSAPGTSPKIALFAFSQIRWLFYLMFYLTKKPGYSNKGRVSDLQKLAIECKKDAMARVF
jgi:hypothetical protein